MKISDTDVINNLKKIISVVGVDSFNNHQRANALINDFFTGSENTTTKRLIKALIDADAFKKISNASNGDHDSVCKALKDILVDVESLSEERAEMAIGWVCGALDKRKPNFPKPVQPKPQPAQTTSSGSGGSYSGQSSSNSSYSPTIQTTQQPRTVSTPSNNTYGLNLNHHVKRKKKVPKKLIGWTVTLCVLAALAYFVVWPNLIYPNMTNEELYTPEIIQTYSGTYSTGNVEGNAVVTITSCDQSGNLTGFFEFIVGNTYGKYEITGKITEKKNNGNLVLSLAPGQWVVQPDDYTPLEVMSVEITDDYQSFECSQYGMYWAVGENDEYSIKTVDDLQKLSGSEATYQLKNDIDLSGVNWKPIDGFKGTLIGNGFTIKNMSIEASSSNVGFFSTLSGAVTSLNFENASVTVSGSNENIGVLCGSMQGTASNITVSGIVKADNSNNVGGVVGYCGRVGNTATINLTSAVDVSASSNVGGVFGSWNAVTNDYSTYTVTLESFINTGNVEAKEGYCGGIMGYVNFDERYSYIVYMNEFKNSGNVSGKTYVGGLIGYGATDNTESYIKDSSSTGTIKAEAYVGCIAGRLICFVVDNCSNEGSNLEATKYITDSGEKYAFVGGYVGRGYLAKNCTNTVSINYTSDGRYVGGILGYTDATGSTSMQNLKNTANITGQEYVGGIIGAWSAVTNDYSTYTVNLEEFENSGTIVAEANYSGGIMGYVNFDERYSYIVYMNEFKNSGNVSGKTYVGGLIGYGATDNIESYIKDSSSTGTIKAEAYVGCIAGRLICFVVDNCSNEGSNLEATKYITDSGEKYAFVGGYVGRGYLAKNCTNTVSINYTSDGRYVGGILGYTDATGYTSMQNLKNTANITGQEYVGGIIGAWNAVTNDYSTYTVNLEEFENFGTIVAEANYSGGIMGYVNFDERYSYIVYMNEFKNSGNVSGKTYVGGLIGYGATDNTESYIKDSSSTGTIKAEAYVGCIAGRLICFVVDNCSNEGSNLEATKFINESDVKCAYVGGFVGRGYLAKNCTNTVSINYTSDGRYVGGILGYTDATGSTSMQNLKNTANITGQEYVGGIIGAWSAVTNDYSNYTVNLNDFINEGSVKGRGDYVGGILGYLRFDERYSYTLYITEFRNTGKITGNSYVGGLLGFGETDSDKSSIVDSSASGSVSGSSNANSVAGALIKIST